MLRFGLYAKHEIRHDTKLGRVRLPLPRNSQCRLAVGRREEFIPMDGENSLDDVDIQPRRERPDPAPQARRLADDRRGPPPAPAVGRMTHRALAPGSRLMGRPISGRPP